MNEPKVLLVGHVCIDHNVTEHARYTDWGSSVLYMADYLQRELGITPDVLTTYGPDMLDFAKPFRLHPAAPSAESTLIYKNIITAKTREWFAENLDEAWPPRLTPEALGLVRATDIIMLAPLLPNYPVEYVRELLRQARPGCLKVLCAQGYLRNITATGKVLSRDFTEAAQLLPEFDLTILSEEDHAQAAELAVAWHKLKGVREVILTQGAQGASFVRGGQLQRIPTKALSHEEIVDSVGCGDIFAMATAYGYFQKRDLPAAIHRGHLAASYKLLSVESTARTQTGLTG